MDDYTDERGSGWRCLMSDVRLSASMCHCVCVCVCVCLCAYVYVQTGRRSDSTSMRSSRRRRTQRKTRNKPTVFEINITRPRLCVPVKGQHPTARYSTERAMNNIVFFKVSISTLCHLPTRALYPCDHMPYQENTKSG